jgi:hypothetical protein
LVKRRVCGKGEAREQVGFEEGDAIREAEADRIALGYRQGGGRDVGGENLGGGKFFGQCDGDATGPSANVHDGEIFAGEFGRATGAEFPDSETIEGDFDEVFGFGAGD